MYDRAQKTRPTMVGLAVGIGMGVSLTPMALAGTATMESSDGESVVWEYRKDAVRMNLGSDSEYVLITDGEFYLVTDEDGEVMVIDGGSLMRSFASMVPDATPDGFNAELVEFEKTGRTETIAGLKGDVYEVRTRDDKGVESTEEIVLSDAKEAREFSEAMITMAETVASLLGRDETPVADALSSRLMDMNLGLLRYGNEVAVSAISSETIAAGRFVLPAEPMNFGGLDEMLGEMQGMGIPSDELDGSMDPDAGDDAGAQEASAFMQMIKSKVDRQTNRISNSVENEVDRETDEAVDKQVRKVFGRLFKRDP